jgi:hypothetical protein
VGIYVPVDIAKAESWVCWQLMVDADNSMLVQRNMETKTRLQGVKEYHGNKLYPAKTTRTSQAASVLADSKKVKRHPNPHGNHSLSPTFQINFNKHLVHCQVFPPVRMEGVNRQREGRIPRVSHNKIISEPIPAPVLDQIPSLVAVILRMDPTMPLNTVKIPGNPPRVQLIKVSVNPR